LLTAIYCSEFCSVYNAAGIASFHPSPEKTELYNCSNSTVAGVDGGRVREMSYSAMESETASLMTSLRKTAVDVRYRRPSTSGIVRE
jgi:hypothetical protein